MPRDNGIARQVEGERLGREAVLVALVALVAVVVRVMERKRRRGATRETGRRRMHMDNRQPVSLMSSGSRWLAGFLRASGTCET